MPGLTSNIINIISDNLRDRYGAGFPILKELIQNADDAGASRVLFGVHDGFATVKHPLLTGPSLCLFNDGGFKASDRRAITSFAENAKAGEPGTIGKFGLGMKSAFHLCEAFLYLAWNAQEDMHRAIVNPWNSGEENLHPDWEDVQADEWALLRTAGAELSGGATTGFLLWMPLRRRRHLVDPGGNQTGAIIDCFPGDDLNGMDLRFLAEADLPSRLAAILPLLLNLKELTYRAANNIGQHFSVSIEADRRLERGHGHVTSTGIVSDQATPLLRFYGEKRDCGDDNPTFRHIRSHSAWPKSFFRDDHGHQKRAPDKSRPEGSVLIAHEDGKSGGLTIRWAVFLPLEEDAHVFRATINSSSRHYHIVLHGQFFVDAGRRGIHEFPKLLELDRTADEDLDESGLRLRWNRELASTVTLPLLLPVLADYVSVHRLPDKQVAELTDAIFQAAARSGGGSRSFLAAFRSSICRDASWIRLIDAKGCRWTLVTESNASLRKLPAPPADNPDRPWQCLPALSKLSGARIFFDGGAPRISLDAGDWDEQDLIAALGDDSGGALSTTELLDYLGKFLEVAAGPYRRHIACTSHGAASPEPSNPDQGTWRPNLPT